MINKRNFNISDISVTEKQCTVPSFLGRWLFWRTSTNQFLVAQKIEIVIDILLTDVSPLWFANHFNVTLVPCIVLLVVLLSDNGSRFQIFSAYGAHINTNENNTSSVLMQTSQAMLLPWTGIKGQEGRRRDM